MRGEVRHGGMEDEQARSAPAAPLSASERKEAERRVADERKATAKRIESRAEKGDGDNG